MRPEEMEDFVLENAILVSKSKEEDKNVFIYFAEDSYFKVTSSKDTKRFEDIILVAGETLEKYLNSGEKRELFFGDISVN